MSSPAKPSIVSGAEVPLSTSLPSVPRTVAPDAAGRPSPRLTRTAPVTTPMRPLVVDPAISSPPLRVGCRRLSGHLVGDLAVTVDDVRRVEDHHVETGPAAHRVGVPRNVPRGVHDVVARACGRDIAAAPEQDPVVTGQRLHLVV